MARLIHHMFIECRRDLVRVTIVHRPHRPNHRTEPSELHRRREADRLVQTVLISDSRMTCGKIRKLWILQIALDDALDGKMSVAQSERGLERLLRVWGTMTRKVHPIILADLFDDPGNTRFLSNYARECGKAIDAPTNVVQFYADSLSPSALAWPMAMKRFCRVPWAT